jgi:uncharacterized protein
VTLGLEAEPPGGTVSPAGRGWALVTGACSGIGLEIARELARRGHPLVLVSDRGPALCDAADGLGTTYGVATTYISMDLSDPAAASRLYGEVTRRGLQVDILVSNAGILMFGEVVTADPERANTLLQLHVVTPSLLATHFGRDMRARRRGHILFVSSVSAGRALPGIAYYGSSKRYLQSFAASLREELRPWGVTVTCLLPGAVATNLYGQTSAPVQNARKYRVVMDPGDVARTAVKGMLAGKATVVPGLSGKAMNLAMRLTPGFVIRLVRDHSRWMPGPPD